MKKVWLLFVAAAVAGLTGCSKIYTGFISISSVPEGAEVYLDDSLTGSVTNCVLDDINVGYHTIALSLDGYLGYSDSVEVLQDDTAYVDVVFDTAASLVVITQPQGADVYLDDSLIGEKTNCTLIGLTDGDYDVRLTLEGYEDLVDDCHLNPGETDTISGYFLMNVEVLWKYTCPDNVLKNISPALGHDGTIFFCASDNSSYYLYMIGKDGNFKRKTEIEEIEGGLYPHIPSLPTIADDGTIYIGTASNICAFNSSGQFQWRYQTGDYDTLMVLIQHPAPAIASDGTIYYGSWDGHLYAFAPDGDTLWTYDVVDPINNSPCISSDGIIYFTAGSYLETHLYAFYPDGEMRWDWPIGYQTSPVAIGPDGTLYLGLFNSNYFVACGPDGTSKWSIQLGGETYYSPTVGPDGTIYVSGSGNSTYALNPDGTQRWSSYIPVDGASSSPTVDSEGNLIISAYYAAVYALNPDGSLKWKSDIDGAGAPLIGPDGTIYILSADNCLYAIKGETGLANSSWPRARANNQNTGRVNAP